MKRQGAQRRIIPDFEYFMARSRVDERGCYVWQRHINNRGYGSGGKWLIGEREETLVHRAAYRIFVLDGAPIPAGLLIDHLCENKSCWNTDHLELVTNSENLRRVFDRSGVCGKGHSLAGNWYVYPNGHRRCRTCLAAQLAASHARRMARKRALQAAP